MTDLEPAGGGKRREASEFVSAVRRRARATLVASAWCQVIAAALGAVFVLVVADFLFRLPRGVRALHLAVLAVGAFELVRRMLLPALRFRPRLADVALRIERSEAGASARGRLASGVELASEPRSGLTGSLAARAAADADAAARSLGDARFLRRKGLARAAAVLGVTALVVGGPGLARPDLAGTGLARLFAPLAKVEWPKRTEVEDATLVEVHPIGEALPLRALLTRTNQAMGRTDVVARYRVLGTGGPAQRAVLTSQNRLADLGDSRGELFERLIEPGAGDAEGEIEYWFETEDDRTETRRIRLAARPRVAEITAAVSPPEYASGLSGSFVSAEALGLSPDSQGVASLGPILAGSRVQISLRLNKAARRTSEAEGWTQADSRTLLFETVASERARTEVVLVDESGLESADPVAIVLEVVEDAPPGVTVIEPAYDESVLSTAVLGVAAEGRDDLGMAWLAIEEQVARRPTGSEGAPHEVVAEPRAIARVEPGPAEPERQLTATAAVDLAVLGARAGDEVWLSATGRDAFTAPDSESDERIVRSQIRRLRIIDELTFVEQLRGELAGVRKAAIEIDREQAALAEPEPGTFDAASAADRQASLTDRIDAQAGTVERLAQRMDRNNLADETLGGMIGDAAALLRDARRESGEAAAELERAGDERRPPAKAAEAQERVREDLESLISMLDQGQDSWVARRTIESLLAEQRALAADTAALGDRTMGEAIEQLTPEELTELERIAARQRDAAERARQALESLTERAEQLGKVDPGQADAMQRAAQRGRQERLPEQMRQAAAQVGENQTRAAAQGQQAATEALEQMLEDMNEAEAARDQALRRVLASVLQSLERLIADQEARIEELNRAREGDELPALAEGMVALASNTLGLLDEIAPQRDLAGVVRLVEEAAGAQQRAVTSLRASSAQSAAEAEDESLARLREARAEAERLEREAGDRETARQRAELREAYRALLEQQAAIAGETEPYVGAELDRRARANVRGLGQRQDALSTALTELRSSSEALAEAAIFELAHARMDAASAGAAERLLDGAADEGVRRRQGTVVRLLRSLIEALAEQAPGQQFRDQQASGGGGGAGGEAPPVIPELAELKLLRAMQAEAMEWTRNIDESPAPGADADLRELAELQRELAERGEALVEKLMQQQQQRPTPTEEPR